MMVTVSWVEKAKERSTANKDFIFEVGPGLYTRKCGINRGWCINYFMTRFHDIEFLCIQGSVGSK